MERTCKNNDLSLKNVNENVTLLGWVAKKRNFGALLFIDLRDRSGLVQVVVNENVTIPDIRNEYIIQVKGVVSKRLSPNPLLKTGEIEVIASEITVINTAKTTPLIIADETDALEDTRLKYRYLDLRRPIMQKYLDLRDKVKMVVHQYLHKQGFIEIDTPLLCASSPEGAKEYLVPSRLHHGSFYALPQSPQIFKQLLMVGGMEKYYQIAHCLRDEDLRSDRQPEFTQIDIEVSFYDQNQLLSLVEGLFQEIFEKTIGYKLPLPLKTITYEEAIEKYGSDKPDTRFGLELHDLKEVFKNTSFQVYQNQEAIKGIAINDVASITTRKVIDNLTLEAKKFGLNGLGIIKKENDELSGSIVKFLSEEEKTALNDVFNLNNNDIVIIAAGAYKRVTMLLGALRNKYAKELNLIKENTYDVLWVVDWPMFEKDSDTNEITALHHPFTRPKDEDLHYLDEDPTKMLSYSYDLVINGYELGSGSLRIYDQDVQNKIFQVLGLSKEKIKENFGYFVEALQYGTPPHGGIGLGLERLVMILGGTDNIRDVVAFPKNLSAVDPMTNAPTSVTTQQLDDLGIDIKE